MHALSSTPLLRLKSDPQVAEAMHQVEMAQERLVRCQAICARETSGGRKLHPNLANARRVYQDDLTARQAAEREVEQVALRRLSQQALPPTPAVGIDDDGGVRINGLRLA